MKCEVRGRFFSASFKTGMEAAKHTEERKAAAQRLRQVVYIRTTAMPEKLKIPKKCLAFWKNI